MRRAELRLRLRRCDYPAAALEEAQSQFASKLHVRSVERGAEVELVIRPAKAASDSDVPEFLNAALRAAAAPFLTLSR